MEISRQQLAKMFDHTLIKPTATKDDIVKLSKEAEKHDFRYVCVNSVC